MELTPQLCSFCSKKNTKLQDIRKLIEVNKQNNKTVLEMLQIFRNTEFLIENQQLCHGICATCLNILQKCDEFYTRMQKSFETFKKIANQQHNPIQKHKRLRVLLPKPEKISDQSKKTDFLFEILPNNLPQKRTYECFECPDIFKSLIKLKKHMKTLHFNNMICQQCNTFYKDCTTFRVHHRKDHQHQNETEQLFLCRECSKTFSTQRKLFKHFRNAHDHPFGVFFCSQCDFLKVSGRENLINHLNNNHPQWKDSQFDSENNESLLSLGHENTNNLSSFEQEDPVMDVEFLEDLVLNQDDNSFQFSDCFEALGLSFEETFEMKNEMNFDHVLEASITKPNSQYNCPRCSEEFLTQTKMFIHLAHIHNEEVLVCNECGRKFNKIHEYSAHKLIHVKENLPYNQIEHTEEPLLVQTREMTFYKCKFCRKHYKNKKNYIFHNCNTNTQTNNVNNGEKDVNQQPIQCNLCNLEFDQIEELNAHNKIEHLNKSLQCRLCDKVLNTLAGLKYHLKTHEATKPLICPYCSRCFLANVNLKAHIKAVHALIKTHLCTLCDRRFATLDHLKKHVMSVHQKERNHFCGVCGRCFSQVSHLKQHAEIHNPKKRLQCEICTTSSFTRRIDLRKHIEREHHELKNS